MQISGKEGTDFTYGIGGEPKNCPNGKPPVNNLCK